MIYDMILGQKFEVFLKSSPWKWKHWYINWQVIEIFSQYKTISIVINSKETKLVGWSMIWNSRTNIYSKECLRWRKYADIGTQYDNSSNVWKDRTIKLTYRTEDFLSIIKFQSKEISLEKLEKRLTNIAYQVALTQNSYFEVVSGVHWVTTSWMTTPWIWWDINQSEIKRHQEVAILHGPSQLTGCWLYDHLGTFYLLVVSCLERWQKGFNEDSQEMPPSRWWHNSDLV